MSTAALGAIVLLDTSGVETARFEGPHGLLDFAVEFARGYDKEDSAHIGVRVACAMAGLERAGEASRRGAEESDDG